MAIVRCSTIPSLLRWPSLGLAALLLGACATQGDMMDNLNKTLRSYEKAIRWAKFDAAYSYHKWEADQDMDAPASMANIRVTSYESSAQRFNPKEKTMKQTITLRYYNTDNLRELTLKQKQEWKFFPDKKRWYLISKPITFP